MEALEVPGEADVTVGDASTLGIESSVGVSLGAEEG